jgi:hypothetical protein
MFRTPNYFFVVFGRAHCATHPVEGGVYGHDANFISGSGIVAGDVMLLYCCGTYPGHNDEVPGLGIVTSIITEGIQYQYFPLCHPIPVDWDTMKVTIPELSPLGNRNWTLKGNFLRKISSSSFRAAIVGRQVDWP